jgi:predicted dehydrogenase
MNRSTKVGIIGLGVMGRNHARVISELENHELVGLVDPLEELKKTSQYGNLLGSLSELIALNPDYCVIAAPTAHHTEIASSLCLANINMIIEKPLAQNLAAANLILESAKSSRSKIAIGHIERFNAAAQLAKLKIGEGLLGEIYQITTSRQGPFPSRIADVGVTLDLATHDIDLTSWLLESPYRSVSAQATFRTGREHEDLVSVTGELANGVVTNHLVNWLSPYKERSTVILGEKGALRIDTLNSDLIFYKNGVNTTGQSSIEHFQGVMQGEVVKFAFDKPEPLKTEHLVFTDYIQGKNSIIASMSDGFETVKVATAILESSKEGRMVKL